MNAFNGENREGFDSRDCVDVYYDGPGDSKFDPLPANLRALLIAEREKIARWQKEHGTPPGDATVDSE